MKSIVINLSKHNMDWSVGDYDGVRSIQKVFKFYTENKLDDIYANIDRIVVGFKSDWFNIKRHISSDCISIDVELVYSFPENEADRKINKDIENAIEKYVANIEIDYKQHDFNNFKELFDTLKDGGELITISIDGISKAPLVEINNVFDALNIDKKIIAIEEQEVECGASAGSIAVIVFICEAIAEGIIGGATYDFLKAQLMNIFRSGNGGIKSARITPKGIEKIRKDLRRMTNMELNDIRLEAACVNDDEIIIIFISDNKKIHLTCDIDYKVINVIVE